MSKMLRPEKIHGEYMTAQASYAPFQCIDFCTGELFAPTEDQCQVEANRVQGVLICHLLRVNCFMLMARLAQYWLMDFYLQVLNQRMSIIPKIKTRTMMGQTRQTSDNLTKHEEHDRRATGYMDEPKNESYLPSSVHGSSRHMTALAKNALGCIVVMLYCCFVVLSSLCIVVLMYCRTVVMLYCCFVVLLSLCIVLLLYCRIAVMLYCFLVVLSSQFSSVGGLRRFFISVIP
jgi:hypothetical protein